MKTSFVCKNCKYKEEIEMWGSSGGHGGGKTGGAGGDGSITGVYECFFCHSYHSRGEICPKIIKVFKK